MIDEEEMKQFMTKTDFEKHPVVDEKDIDHFATIKDVRLVNVTWNDRQYKKLLLEVELDTGEPKVVFLTKSFALDITSHNKLPENLNEWVGRRVKLVPIKVQTRGGLKTKIVIEPVE